MADDSQRQGKGRMTMVLSKFTDSLQESDKPKQVGMDDFIQGVKDQTLLTHDNCSLLFVKMENQKREYLSLTEENRRELVDAVRSAKTSVESIVSSLFPYMDDRFFLLLMEHYQNLLDAVNTFLVHVSVVLMKFQRVPLDEEVSLGSELYHRVRSTLRDCIISLKNYEQEKQEQSFVVTFSEETLPDFVALCKETLALLNKLSSIAAHDDAVLSSDPEEAEEAFLDAAGQLLANLKTICKYCVAGNLEVREETLRDQSTRMISSAKLLFRTRASYASDLFEDDKEALMSSVKDIVLEISNRKKQGTLGQAPPIKPDRSKKEKEEELRFMRSKIIEEILTTETNYVGSLRTTKALYMKEMKLAKWLTPAEFQRLFTNLGSIVALNSLVLAEIQKTCKEVTQDLYWAMIGKLFIDQAEGFLHYAGYINGFDEALKVLAELQTRPKATAFFYQIIQENSQETKLLDLGAYLIMPVQRLPRYELLLRELKKYTPKDHPDATNVDDAINKIKLVNAKINELKRQEENRVRWNKIKESLTSVDVIPTLEKTRWVFHEGPADVAVNKGKDKKKSAKMYIYLFDDMVLFTEQRKKKFSVKYFVPFDGSSTSQPPTIFSGPEESSLTFTSHDTGTTIEFIMTCSSPEDKTKWFENFQSAMSATFG